MISIRQKIIIIALAALAPSLSIGQRVTPSASVVAAADAGKSLNSGLTDQVLYQYLISEIAGQRGRNDVAAAMMDGMRAGRSGVAGAPPAGLFAASGYPGSGGAEEAEGRSAGSESASDEAAGKDNLPPDATRDSTRRDSSAL